MSTFWSQLLEGNAPRISFPALPR